MSNQNPGRSSPEQHTTTADIIGLHCGGCASTAERRLRQIPGVQNVTVSYPPGHATITHGPRVSVQQLQEALTSLGYTLRLAR